MLSLKELLKCDIPFLSLQSSMIDDASRTFFWAFLNDISCHWFGGLCRCFQKLWLKKNQCVKNIAVECKHKQILKPMKGIPSNSFEQGDHRPLFVPPWYKMFFKSQISNKSLHFFQCLVSALYLRASTSTVEVSQHPRSGLHPRPGLHQVVAG